ncbi:heavy metal translocating P-type ATPase [Okeania sp. SIO1I7]|uniref:heavy metal translocating P-type ATPase n=1 Tax=Okeania sp. SIO1I7 TaxID=2607772 RepID=UPI0013F857B0|nr:heavy metal translocating P-type ATPase [Okeania sp. SIO1I7]NET27438.1 cadmium-translocating P-type ATPase [Okeania sp. SIO1I7]
MINHNHSHCCSCHHEENHTDINLPIQGSSLKQEILPLLPVIIIYILGLIFYQQLQNNIYGIGKYIVFIPIYIYSGWTVLTTAGKNILKGRIFDENFLMTVATLAAIAINKLPEAVAVMLFYQIGETFQEYSVKRSRSSIKSLLEIRPDYANLKIDNSLQKVSPEIVAVGSEIVVKPGEKIPLDGEIISGSSQVDTSALTGESIPRNFTVGQTILAGMVNQTGVLTIYVTKPFSESSISRILELVETAKTKKSKTERFMTTFARYYTPVVVFISLAIALLPPLFISGATYADWINRALIVLVVSCPCGLVISIPLGYFGGVGGAAKRGILVKGSTFLDDLAAIKTVVFDKTGTLTEGKLQVTDIVTKNGLTKPDLIAVVAKVESLSNHPIAQAVSKYNSRKIDYSDVSEYEEIAGCGIKAKVGNKTVIAGSERLLHLEDIQHDICDIGDTAVHLAIDSKYVGYIVISDQIKLDAARAIKSLKSLGVEKTVMLTGDNQTVAQRVAKNLGLDDYQAELLPEGKVIAIEKLLHKNNGKVAFVGDGINDAPVIARADVGMAMGSMGSDAAIETADVVIMSDAPSKVAEAIQIGRKTRRIVWQNIGFAIGVKGLFILLGIAGLANIWEAVFADVGVALIAIFNSSRASMKSEFRSQNSEVRQVKNSKVKSQKSKVIQVKNSKVKSQK